MPKSQLSELIEKALKSGLTFRDIRRRSGNLVPLSSLNAWHKSRPEQPNLTVATIQALARGLGESPTVVLNAVMGRQHAPSMRDASLAQLLEDYGRLPARDREALKVIIEMLRSEIQNRLDRDI